MVVGVERNGVDFDENMVLGLWLGDWGRFVDLEGEVAGLVLLGLRNRGLGRGNRLSNRHFERLSQRRNNLFVRDQLPCFNGRFLTTRKVKKSDVGCSQQTKKLELLCGQVLMVVYYLEFISFLN